MSDRKYEAFENLDWRDFIPKLVKMKGHKYSYSFYSKISEAPILIMKRRSVRGRVAPRIQDGKPGLAVTTASGFSVAFIPLEDPELIDKVNHHIQEWIYV